MLNYKSAYMYGHFATGVNSVTCMGRGSFTTLTLTVNVREVGRRLKDGRGNNR